MSTDALVGDYLARLEQAAQRLPTDRRADLLDGIGEHIASARAAGAAADEAAVRTLLDRLGEPEDIVAAAQEDLPVEPVLVPRGTGRELAAVLMLTLGSFLPVVGWVAGVVLLWSSTLWTAREKVLGTLVVPLGPGGLLLWAFVTPAGKCIEYGESLPDGRTVSGATCSAQALPWAASVLALAVLVSTTVVAVLLMRRARRRAAEQPVAAPAAAVGPTWGGLELAAVLTLGLGGMLVPLAGTVVGLALAWFSPRWRRVHKLVATAVVVLPVALPFVVPSVGLAVGFLGGFLGLVLGGAVAAVYLAVALQRGQRSPRG